MDAANMMNVEDLIVEKIKVVEEPTIINRIVNDSPYYEIKFKPIGHVDHTIGFGSFNFDFIKEWLDTRFELVDDAEESKYDTVSHPSHYTEGRKYEPRKVIRDWDLNFNLGSAVKYISRAGRKGNKVEDLKKAIQFIKFEIEELEGDQYD